MSNNSEPLLAVRSTRWTRAEEAKLREALRANPIILDWLVDAQADTVESDLLRPVTFEEPAHVVAVTNAYSKGRLSQILELIGQAQLLLKQPADQE